MTTGARRRTSRQRTAVEDQLGDNEAFRSAQDIYADMREQGNPIGLATVYRALQQLADDGKVDVLRTDEGETVYRRCSTQVHHHHLVCRECGHTVEIAGSAVERWAAEVARQHGFAEVDHVVEVFGTCTGCTTR